MAVTVKELYVSDTLRVDGNDDVRLRIYHLRSDDPVNDNCRSAGEIAEFLKNGGNFDGWALWYGSWFRDDSDGTAIGTSGESLSTPIGVTDNSKLRVTHVDIERIGGNQFTLCDYRLTYKFSRNRIAWQPRIRWSTQEKNKRIFRDLNAEACPYAGNVPMEVTQPCSEDYYCLPGNRIVAPGDCRTWFSYLVGGAPGTEHPPGADYLGRDGQGVNVVEGNILWEFSRLVTIYQLNQVENIGALLGSINGEVINIITAGDVTTNITAPLGRWLFDDWEGEQLSDLVFRITGRFLSDRNNHYMLEYVTQPGTSGKIARPPLCIAKRVYPIKCWNFVLQALGLGLSP